MFAFFLGALGVLFLMGVGDWFLKAPSHSLRRGIGFGLIGLLALVVVIFALSGRLAMAVAGLFVLMPWVIRLVNLWALGQFLGGVFRSRPWGGANSEPGASAASGPMDRAEALRILDLHEGATPHAIREAYQRLIRRVHPDQGGSTYLAARLNEAKMLLLGE